MSEKSVKAKGKPADAGSPGFFGSVTVGERGQIVIPKEAREAFHIQAGERLILVGHPKKGLMLAKADELREFAKKLLENVG